MTVRAAYCPRCGAALPGTPPTRCTGCGYELYVNARPTGGVIAVDGDGDGRPPRFLAIKRAVEPRAGRWELPGGFCDGWEHPAAAAVREAREELGVEVVLGELVGMYVGSYDFQGERLPVLDCFFLARLDAADIALNGAEASDLTWFELAEPPAMAFATMDAALADALGRFPG